MNQPEFMPALKSIVTKGKSLHKKGRAFYYCGSNGPVKTQILKTSWALLVTDTSDLDKLCADTELSWETQVFKPLFQCYYQIFNLLAFSLSQYVLTGSS